MKKVSTFKRILTIHSFIVITSGFLLILEPFETEIATVPNPIFISRRLVLDLIITNQADSPSRCLDPSLAIKPVFERFSSVVITSGTISPLDMYPKMLQFTPVVQETYPMTLTRNAFLPLVLSCLFSLHQFLKWSHRLLLEEVIRLLSARASKSEMIPRLSAISGASSSNIARSYQMVL